MKGNLEISKSMYYNNYTSTKLQRNRKFYISYNIQTSMYPLYQVTADLLY